MEIQFNEQADEGQIRETKKTSPRFDIDQH